jgi:ribosomal protein L7/L12
MTTKWEYSTEILTTLVGRDKLRLSDLDSTLKKRGDAGWELVNLDIRADVKGNRDGHLLIFKRAVPGSSGPQREAPAVVAHPTPELARRPEQQASEKPEADASFSVVLSEVGRSKIAVIKVIKDVTGLGLKESKDLADCTVSVPASQDWRGRPVEGREGAAQVIKSGLTLDEAQSLVNNLHDVGATAEVREQ